MQLPENAGERRSFERRSFVEKLVTSAVGLLPAEGPSLETSKFSLYFSGSCISTNESLLLLALPSTYTGTDSPKCPVQLFLSLIYMNVRNIQYSNIILRFPYF